MDLRRTWKFFDEACFKIKNEGYTIVFLLDTFVDVSNNYDSYYLNDVEYTWDGIKREHIPYCKICRAGGPEKGQLAEHDPPRIVHRLIDENY